MKTIFTLSLALVLAGFFSATAQNYDIENKKIQLQNAMKTKAGQDWWEPDTLYNFAYYGENAMSAGRCIFEYKKLSQGLLVIINIQAQSDNFWIDQTQITRTYDSKNNILNETLKDWGNDSWINSQLFTYTYDSNSNLLTRMNQNWINNSWENSKLYTCTYDSNNNLLTEINQNWINNSWESYDLTTRTYDSNNNELSFTRQILEDNLWRYIFNQYIYTYDSNNNVLTKLSQYLSNDIWQSSYFSTYTYDSNNRKQTHLYQTRQNDSWENTLFETYTYDSNDNLLTVLTTYDSDERSTLVTCTYDSDNNLLTELRQSWKNDLWVNGLLKRMIYDKNGNGISSESLRWINESWQPTNNSPAMSYPTTWISLHYNNMQNSFGMHYRDKLTASYIKVSDLITGVEPILEPELNSVSVYPNPTTGELKIENGELLIKDIRIFDMSGISVFNTQQTTFDVSHLPAGLYFVQITTEKGIVMRKVVKK